MMVIRLLTIALLSVVAGCGGTVDLTCDEVKRYELAKEGKRIEVPDGLDTLDELKEIPLPQASPRDERPKGSPCLDLPPSILGQE
jgi:hypothetical protein